MFRLLYEIRNKEVRFRESIGLEFVKRRMVFICFTSIITDEHDYDWEILNLFSFNL